MNKKELIGLVSEKSELTKKDCGLVLETILETIVETLEKGEKVQLVGFGTFETRKRAERQGRNPSTGEEMTIPAMVSPAFKVGNKFKTRVKEAHK